MSTKTNIAWTDHTFNPWWGYFYGCWDCQRVSKRTRTKQAAAFDDYHEWDRADWNE